MPYYESWVGIGCPFVPEKMLEKFIKTIPAKRNKVPQYHVRTGERMEDEEITLEPEKEIVDILGNIHEIDLESLCNPYEEVLEAIAKAIGADYSRGGYCYPSGDIVLETIVHAFTIKSHKGEEKLSWIVNNAPKKCATMIAKLKKLGLKVGKPQLIHGASES